MTGAHLFHGLLLLLHKQAHCVFAGFVFFTLVA